MDGKAGDETRLPIIASLMSNGNGQYQFEKMDSNFLTSVYGHKALDSILVHAITMDKILYVDKEKALELGNLAKLTLLGRLPQLGLNGIIHQSQNIVNEADEKNTQGLSDMAQLQSLYGSPQSGYNEIIHKSQDTVNENDKTLLSFMDSLYGVGFTVLKHNKPLSLDRFLDKKTEDQRAVVITDGKTIDVLAEREKNAVYINRISTLNNGSDTTDVDMIRSAIRMRPDVIHFEDGSGWTEIKNTKFDIESDVKNVYSGYRLLDYGPISHYKEDRYLNAVLALAQDGSYTTWIHNSYTGLQLGHYGIRDIDRAYLDYYGRMREDMRPEYRVCRYNGKYLPEAYRRLYMEDILEDVKETGEVVGYFGTEEEAKNYLESVSTEVKKDSFGRLDINLYAVEQHQYDNDGDLLTSDVIAITEKAPYVEQVKEKLVPMPGSDKLGDLKKEYDHIRFSTGQEITADVTDLDDEI